MSLRVPVPDHILQIHPYVPGKPVEEVERELGLTDVVKMASNENPLGPSPKALAALHDYCANLHYYPEGSGFYLRQALSKFYAIPMDHVILGSGSVDLIELICRAFMEAGTNAVTSAHSFVSYRIAVQAAHGEFREAPMTDRTYDLSAIESLVDDHTRVVLIANPNNPTGTYVSYKALEDFLQRIPDSVLVVVDEAYKEFVEKDDYATVQPLLERHPNLVVLGTFSKAYGLAGLRIGYGFADPGILNVIHRVRSPFNANSAAQVAGIAALDDQEFVRKYVELNLRERRYLSERLTDMGVTWTPSVANFILVDVPMDGREFFEKLLREGVIVRPMGVCGLPDSMRVSVHLREGNDRFLAATKKVLGL